MFQFGLLQTAVLQRYLRNMCDFEKIKLVVLDVDGTLTDGGIYYDSNGNEIKRFDVKDGLGIKVAMEAGLKFAILTGRQSPMVRRRAEELGIQYLIEGVQKKAPALMELSEKTGISLSEMAYIGDDWNDLQAMMLTGFKACPSDVPEEIKNICDYVAEKEGGRGAVREVLENLLKARNQWSITGNKIYFK